MDTVVKVATVIVTWNQTDLTLDCLAALVAAGVAQETIWVVDNGSADAALARIGARFPAIHTLRLEQNRGFTGGCNAGMRAALGGGAEQVFLLNNDALVEPGTLPALVEALDRDPGLAAASPKVYYAIEGQVIQSVGLQIDLDSGQTRMLGSNEPDHGQYDQPAEREALFGCAMLIRRQAWEQVGEFWEPFFSYAEESDWCLRARRAGWRLLYVPPAVVRHRTSSSLGWDSPLKTYLIARNQLYLRQRHQRGGWRGARGLAYALYVGGRTWARMMRHGKRAQARAIELAWWDVARGRSGDARGPDLRLKDSSDSASHG